MTARSRKGKMPPMWFDQSPHRNTRWAAAAKHLAKVDPRLGQVIDHVGPCTLAPRRDYFVALCKSIFSQQLSTLVAAALFDRFLDQFPARRPTPELLLQAFAERHAEFVRLCGLSRGKAVYLKDLAQHFVDKKIPTRKLGKMTDEAVIESLVAVKGIGRWTAEMFLMFVLNRPDVLPIDDLGLRMGVGALDELPERPTPKAVLERGEIWRPYRTIASWYVWRGKAAEGRASKPAAIPPKSRTKAAESP